MEEKEFIYQKQIEELRKIRKDNLKEEELITDNDFSLEDFSDLEPEQKDEKILFKQALSKIFNEELEKVKNSLLMTGENLHQEYINGVLDFYRNYPKMLHLNIYNRLSNELNLKEIISDRYTVMNTRSLFSFMDFVELEFVKYHLKKNNGDISKCIRMFNCKNDLSARYYVKKLGFNLSDFKKKQEYKPMNKKQYSQKETKYLLKHYRKKYI